MKKTLLLSTALVLTLAGCRKDPVHRDWGAMSSNFAVSLQDPCPGAVPAEAALDSLQADSRRWDSLFSDYSEKSGLTVLRGRKGDTVTVAPEVDTVLREALVVGALSSGNFDVGMHDTKALWDLASPSPRIPPTDSLTRMLTQRWGASVPPADSFRAPLEPLPGHRYRLLTDSLPIDLGGIAKGYVVDRMSARLAALGWPVHLIQAGGEIRCAGRKERPWAIGVKNPRRTDTVIGVIHLDSGRAVSTSGDYERFFLAKGGRWHHIIDPRTGTPPQGRSVSTTVLCARSITCDVNSTALFLLGPKAGIPVAARQGLEALWVRETPAGLCGLTTPGWAGRLERTTLPECKDSW